MIRRLATQGVLYVFAGLSQLLIDWAVFSLLFALTGVAVASNVTSRATAAGLGFWFNGRYTFASDGQPRLGPQRFARYAVAWCLLTTISTLAVAAIEWTLGSSAVYWGKPLVEAVLAMVSFAIARLWVYD